MSHTLQVSCFDVDHVANPKTKRASKLDHVSIMSIGRLNCAQKEHAAFLIDICSFGNPLSTYFLARVAYSGPDENKRHIYVPQIHSAETLVMSKGGGPQIFDCLKTNDRNIVLDILAAFWRCYGGSWIIATDCSEDNLFVDVYVQAEHHQIAASEARDRLVCKSRIAAVSFDDDILDVVTRVYKAEEMRDLILRSAVSHHIDVQMFPSL